MKQLKELEMKRTRIKATPKMVATTKTSKASMYKAQVLECKRIKLEKLAKIN
jgi:hypothetical protein